MAVYQNISLTQVSQDPAANTSQVRILWRSTQTGGSYNLTQRTAHYTVYVNGAEGETLEVDYVLPMQSTQTIVDTTVTVPHNDKGEASVTVTTWMHTHISAGIVELSKTLELDDIPRASTLRAADGIIGGSAKVSVVKKNSNFSHSIACSFGAFYGFVDGEGQLGKEEVTFSADSIDLHIPEHFYDQIPNAKSGSCVLKLQTYDGEVPVGELQEATFTVTAEETVCRPTVTGTVVDVNEATLALTGDETVLVRFMSNGHCTVSAHAQKGAQITKKYISGQSVEGDSLQITGIEQETVSFAVTDSRGYTAEYIHTGNMIPYIKLSAEASAERENAGSQAMVYVSGDCFSGCFGAEDNALTVEVTVDGGETIWAEATVSENRYYAFAELADMDYTRLYGITVRVSDKLMQVEKRLTLKKAIPVFDWGEGDFAFHVPVAMDSPLSLESGGTGASGAAEARENLGLVLPMLTEQEYATLEHWNGQTVYTKLLEFGTMPNSDVRAVAHNTGASRVLQCRGSTSEGWTLPYGGKHTQRADLFCDRENVYIDTESDCSAQTATVQIWYIK